MGTSSSSNLRGSSSSPSRRQKESTSSSASSEKPVGKVGSALSKVRGNAADLVPWSPADRWKLTMGGKKLTVSASRGGRVGLSNLGNTCFMNAGLQCLSHIEPIVSYFLTGKHQEEVNEKNSMGSGGHLARGFAKLQEQLWQRSGKTQSPKQLHSTLAKFAPHLFEGYDQQDAQEFLAYFLDGLHEDLNLVREPPPRPQVDDSEDAELRADEEQAQLEEEKGEEYVAALAWMHHLSRHKSFLVDLFQGQLRSQVTCSVCGKVSKTFDPYLYMSLPVHDRMKSVEEALRCFLAEETLSGQEQWRCNRCKKRVNAKKKIDIWKLPPVLVIHLKRFEFDTKTYRFRKIQAELKSRLTIDLSDFVQTEQKESLVYDIMCVANHSGPFGSGHYTATCRHPIDGRFYHFNDGHVEEVKDIDKVVSHKAYVLFLIRNASTEDLVRQSVSHPEVWPHAVSKHNSVMLPAVWDWKSTLAKQLKAKVKGKKKQEQELHNRDADLESYVRTSLHSEVSISS
mmetsp:Transcript_10540/g.19394  ORF Transcript_10540/g.19394 Transcript_10540/m.19394 type:complete len:510 (+) Transcript_10540:92-1621(+)